MKPTIILVSTFLFALEFSTHLQAQPGNGNGDGNAGSDNKVTICHVPPGNPSNAHTITISKNAVDAHFRNHDGDHYGACEQDTTPPPCVCDYDGDGQADAERGSTDFNADGTLSAWFSPFSDTVKVKSTQNSISSVTLQLSDGNQYKFNNQKTYLATYTVPYQYTGATIEGVWLKAGSNKGNDGSGTFLTNYHSDSMNNTCTCDTGPTFFPVRMTRFDAIKKGDKVELKWSTASEENNDYFSIEKTYNNDSWEEVCRVKGSGTTQKPHDYSCTDNAPQEGGNKLVYYRPKQVDFNGAYEYFTVIKLRLEPSSGAASVNNVYPNPITERLFIQYNASENGIFNIRLLSLDGKELVKQQYIAKPGEQVMDLDIPEGNLSPGYYILEVENNGQIYHNKLYKR